MLPDKVWKVKDRELFPYSIDIETSSDGSLLGVSACWGETYEQTMYSEEEGSMQLLVTNAFATYLITHNGEFDFKLLRKYFKGIDRMPDIQFDTWVAAAMMWPKLKYVAGELTLKNLAVRRLGAEPWGNASEMVELFGGMENVPYEQREFYARMDALNTWLLGRNLVETAQNAGMLKIIEVESQMLNTVIWMNECGVYVDRDTIKFIKVEVQAEINQLQEEIYAVGPVALNTPQSVSNFLFKYLEIPSERITKTKSGFPSTAEAQLEKVLDYHPVVQKILTWRKVSKLMTTFLPSISNPGKDSRLYPTWSSIGTVQGRMGCAGPTLMNIPATEETGRGIRRAFSAPDGFVIVRADLSQIDIRAFAAVADVKALKGIFARKEDVHTATAAAIYGIPLDQVSKDQRRAAKAINFGIMYGMSWYGLLHYGLTKQQAIDFYNRYVDMFEIEAYFNWVREQTYKSDHTKTWFGRRIPTFPGSNAAKNYPISGTAIDIMKIGMNAIYNQLVYWRVRDLVRLTIQVHDEIVMEVHKDVLDEVIPKIKQALENIPFPVPIVAEVGTGLNWAETEVWNG